MRDWDWGSIWGGLRWARLGLVVLAGLSGSWFGHAHHSRRDPEMAAAVVRAFSEEAGFAMPANYQYTFRFLDGVHRIHSIDDEVEQNLLELHAVSKNERKVLG